jgi:hypothetical protein
MNSNNDRRSTLLHTFGRKIIWAGILAMGSMILFLTSCSSQPTVPSDQPPLEATATLPPPSERKITQTPEALPPSPTPTATLVLPTPIPPVAPDPNSLLGVEIHDIQDPANLELAVSSGVQLVRYNAIRWYDVEPEQGTRDWNQLAKLDDGLAYLGENGVQTILIVRGTPLFAQKVPGYYCGPFAEQSLPEFADFLGELVTRYSQPPYNVKYWELGNEPDVAPELVGVDSVFGCWGDAEQPDYGGRYYAEMLKQAYPAIKQADPDANVLIGGLLLDCDPTHPPEGKTCQPANFLDGILAAGGGDYFDLVSYHGYPPYSNGKALDERLLGWEDRGGVIIGKLNFIREVMQKYGIDKPIFHTESSLTCPTWNARECDPIVAQFYQTQAEFVPRLFLRNWAYGIDGTVWYQFEGVGWRSGGMVGAPTNPKQTLRAFQHMTEVFGGAEYLDAETDSQEFTIYRFQKNGQQIWSIWTPDWESRTYTLPAGASSVTDIFGTQVGVDNNQILVDGVRYITFGN